MTDETMVRVLRTWAADAADFAQVLATQDPSWKSETFPLAGGHVVLCGAGMYVNRAIGVGLDGALSHADWRQLEVRCDAVGVARSIEVSPATDNDVRRQLARRGYRPDGTTSALFCALDTLDGWPDPVPTFSIEPANGELLAVWQATSAACWGHVTADAVSASNAFARAAAVVDGEGLLLARDTHDGRPVGCASLTIRDGVATLGAMSTMPDERGRGVQSALIVHRVRLAVELGCDIVTSTTAAASVSERNLLRHRFERRFAIDTHTHTS